MKTLYLIVSITLTIGFSFETRPAIAENRVKIYELAESGQTFEFPMKPAEIAYEDTTNARHTAIRQAKLFEPEKRLKVIEMGESGQTVVFPMNSKEIAAEDAERARLAALRKTAIDSRSRVAESFELAESGITIDFQIPQPEAYAKNQ